LIKGWEVADHAQDEVSAKAVDWMHQRMAAEILSIDDSFSKYRLNDAALSIYKLVWDEFCSWYLEAIKPAYGEAIDRVTYEATLSVFEQLMTLLHPIMPFITEEVWHSLRERRKEECVIVATWPASGVVDHDALAAFETAKQVVTEVRALRAQRNLSPKDALNIIQTGEAGAYADYANLIAKLANVQLTFGERYDGPSASFIVGTLEFTVPLEGLIDAEQEIKKLKDELSYQEGFLNSVMKKLSNERFVQGAPEPVVAAEQKKKADAESRISSLKEQLSSLGA
jgi:valyl-tRNA synthetase